MGLLGPLPGGTERREVGGESESGDERMKASVCFWAEGGDRVAACVCRGGGVWSEFVKTHVVWWVG